MNEFLLDDNCRKRVSDVLTKLNGYTSNFFLFKEFIPVNCSLEKRNLIEPPELIKISFNQLNELQMVFGYQSLPLSFFTYLRHNDLLIPGNSKNDLQEEDFDAFLNNIELSELSDYQESFENLEQLEKHVDIFRTHALLFFGNIRKCLRIFTESTEKLIEMLAVLCPVPVSHFKLRPDPLNKLEIIVGEETYYLGHLIQNEINNGLEQNPEDEKNKKLKGEMEEVITKGKYNYNLYLARDVIDIYIATSMRKKEDFYIVNKNIKEIFDSDELKELKLSYFDPTQAFCDNRIDKGLLEALMLRKAVCTIYFIQENDTFGKDSELASTLAQGKPVIAFLPEVNSDYISALVADLEKLYPSLSKAEILLNKLKDISPEIAWENEDVRHWIIEPISSDVEKIQLLLLKEMETKYKKRYDALIKHPLGVQVNISNGVANGVLVVRTVKSCAQLLLNIMTSRMEYTLREKQDRTSCLYLEEKISKSVYRVVSDDFGLTNSYLNYYPEFG